MAAIAINIFSALSTTRSRSKVSCIANTLNFEEFHFQTRKITPPTSKTAESIKTG